jgi:hypothetical protein
MKSLRSSRQGASSTGKRPWKDWQAALLPPPYLPLEVAPKRIRKMMNPSSSVVEKLLKDTPIPRVARVRQHYDRPVIPDVGAGFLNRLHESGLLETVQPGMSLAIGVGSRGIANQPLILKLLVSELRKKGAEPFLFPAMGSHGGAVTEGQQAVLERMGISEEVTGAPIRATMEVVEMGKSANGLSFWLDSYAAAADGIVCINRVKPHTSFRATHESGLMKMIAIGFGKQKGAETCHQFGMERLAENILALGRAGIATGKILFGIALVENAYHETCRIEVIPAARIEEEDAVLQVEAKRLIPRLPFDEIDVLIIDEIGKDIAGTGFDPNVVGRYHLPHMKEEGRRVTRMAALDLTEATKGNSNGLGIFDFTTERAFRKVNFEETYPNSLTSTVPDSVKIPMVVGNDRLAAQAAIRTCNVLDLAQVRLVRIRNTLEAHTMEISENMIQEARAILRLEILSDPYELAFDSEGNLLRS